jgi:hypothetical protein
MMNCPPLATVIHFGLASAPCASGQGLPASAKNGTSSREIRRNKAAIQGDEQQSGLDWCTRWRSLNRA